MQNNKMLLFFEVKPLFWSTFRVWIYLTCFSVFLSSTPSARILSIPVCVDIYFIYFYIYIFFIYIYTHREDVGQHSQQLGFTYNLPTAVNYWHQLEVKIQICIETVMKVGCCWIIRYRNRRFQVLFLLPHPDHVTSPCCSLLSIDFLKCN